MLLLGEGTYALASISVRDARGDELLPRSVLQLGPDDAFPWLSTSPSGWTAPPAPPRKPPPPPLPCVCMDKTYECPYTEDGVCDDGGDGAALCRYRKATHKRLGQSGGEQASAATGEAWAGTLLRPACLSGQSAWPLGSSFRHRCRLVRVPIQLRLLRLHCVCCGDAHVCWLLPHALRWPGVAPEADRRGDAWPDGAPEADRR